MLILVVDGLGWFPFAHWATSGGERGSRWASFARPVTSVFPTTTSSALVSLSTGTGPATHGIVGYRQYLPRYGVVADMLKFSPISGGPPGSLVGPNWRPELVSGAASLFSRGLPGAVVTRRDFQGTPFTRLLYEGAEFVPYSTASDLGQGIRHLLSRAAPPPVVFAYWDELDTVQHLHGPGPELAEFELNRIVQLLEFVHDGVPSEVRRTTTVLVTSDHGQVPATREALLRVEEMPDVVREMSRPLAGDRRAALFAARPGRVEALQAALVGHLPRDAKLMAIPEAVRGGLFGPPPFHPELHDRLGDLLVLLPSPGGLTYLPPGGASSERHLAGAHGGLEPQELIVPLVAGTLEGLGFGGAPRPK